MADDHFALLGLTSAATADEVQSARRALAKELHPDVLGHVSDADRDAAGRRLAEVNQATDEALRLVAVAERSPVPPGSAAAPEPADWAPTTWEPVEGDLEASFSISLLPVEAFEVVLLAFAAIGDPRAVDEPYLLEGQVDDPAPCFATVHLVPEAGGSIVTVEVRPFARSRLRPPAAAVVVSRLVGEIRLLGLV